MENLISFEEFKTRIDNGERTKSVIDIKDNVSHEDKMSIISSMKENCIEEIEGSNLKRINYLSKDILYTILLIKHLTNLDLDSVENKLELYDYLSDNYIIDDIKIVIKGLCKLEYIIDEELEQEIKINNSFEKTIKTILDDLMKKIPSADELSKLVDKVKSEVENFDSSKLNKINDLVNLTKGKN